MIDDFNKSKEEQKKEFEEIISPWADPKCKNCFGTAIAGWSEEHKRFLPCCCIDKNIQNELEKRNMPEAEKQGLLTKFRTMFGLN